VLRILITELTLCYSGDEFLATLVKS